MSFLGRVFNKANFKKIDLVISKSGDGFKRLTSAISSDSKSMALEIIKERFEGGEVFKDDDMKRMDQLVVTHMLHSSRRDPNPHYSLYGVTADGIIVRGGHVAVNKSQQTQAK